MLTIELDRFTMQAGDRVLDLGCGEGRHVISLYVAAEVLAVGVDLGFRDLQTSQSRFSEFAEPDNPRKSFALLQSNAMTLPFADDSFDTVVCSEVLEHIPDYQGALAEIARVVRPGGTFIASVPRFFPEKICWLLSDAYHEVEGGHVRIFHGRKLESEIECAGFTCYARHYAHALHAPYWWLQCLLWSRRDRSRLIRWYHQLLVWDLLKRPRITRIAERMLNPLIGKSVVMYFTKG